MTMATPDVAFSAVWFCSFIPYVIGPPIAARNYSCVTYARR